MQLPVSQLIACSPASSSLFSSWPYHNSSLLFVLFYSFILYSAFNSIPLHMSYHNFSSSPRSNKANPFNATEISRIFSRKNLIYSLFTSTRKVLSMGLLHWLSNDLSIPLTNLVREGFSNYCKLQRRKERPATFWKRQ